MLNDHLPNLPNYFVVWPIEISHLETTIILKLMKSIFKRAQGKYR